MKQSESTVDHSVALIKTRSLANSTDLLSAASTAVRVNLAPRSYSSTTLLNAVVHSPSRHISTRKNRHLSSTALLDIQRAKSTFQNANISASLAMSSELEMRIVDAITGDDPMQEGTKSLEDVERNRLEEERKAVLGLTGAQRIMLQDRYDQLRDTFVFKTREIGASANACIQNVLLDFKQKWKIGSADGAYILDLLSTEKLAQISRDHILSLTDDIFEASRSQESKLKQLEKQLVDIEFERSRQIAHLVEKFSKQLKKLNFKRPVMIDRMLQEECISANLIIIANYEAIHKYIATLHSVNVDVDSKMKEYLLLYGKKWNQARYDFVYTKFVEALSSVLDVDVHELYMRFQDTFHMNVKQQSKMLKEITEMHIDQITCKWLVFWRSKVKKSVEDQERSINEFQKELADFETKMDNSVKNLIEFWFPSFEECETKTKEELDVTIQNQVKTYRKTAEILAGKRACILLSSQASRNRVVLEKVAEFIVCLLAIKAEFSDHLAVAELDTVAHVHDISADFLVEKTTTEKALQKEMAAIHTETRESLITQRLSKCQELFKAIDNCLHQMFKQSSGTIESMEDKIHVIQTAYKDKITAMFKLDAVSVGADQSQVQKYKQKLHAEDSTYSLKESQSLDTFQNSAESLVKFSTGLNAASLEVLGNDLAVVNKVQSNSHSPANLISRVSSVAKLDPNLQPDSSKKTCTTFENLKHEEIRVHEVEFFSKKVAEWRQEQIYQAKVRAAQIESESLVSKSKKTQPKPKHGKNTNVPYAKHERKHSDASVAFAHIYQHAKEDLDIENKLDCAVLKPTLLDGTEYTMRFDAVLFLADMDFPSDLNASTYISNTDLATSVNDIDHAVQIPHIPTELLRDLRLYLEQTTQNDQLSWEMSVNQSITERIKKKLEILTSARNLEIIEYEKRLHKVFTLAQSRLDLLKHLRTSHENEACVLFQKINTLQNKYAAEIQRLIAISVEFSTLVIAPLATKMEKVQSRSELRKLQTDFHNQMRLHSTSLKKCLLAATNMFDHEKAAILKSRVVGNHAAAWQILKDLRMADPDTVSQELENWRKAFDEEIERVQTETGNSVSQFNIDFAAYLDDFDMIDRVGQSLASLRLQLKAEWVRYTASQKELELKIKSLHSLRENSELTWIKMQHYISECEHIRFQISKNAYYLDCLNVNVYPAIFNANPPKTLAEWKCDKQNDISAAALMSSLPKLPKKATGSRKDLDTKQGSESSVQLAQQKYESRSNEGLKKTSLINSDCTLPKLGLDGELQSIESNTRSQKLMSTSILALSDSSEYATGQAKAERRESYSRSYSASTILSNDAMLKESQKGSSFRKYNAPRSAGSLQSVNCIVASDTKLGTLSNDGFQHGSLQSNAVMKDLMGNNSILKYTQLYMRWFKNTRQDIQEHCEGYYAMRSEKDIRKKDEILPNQYHYMKSIDQLLAKVEIQAEQWRKEKIKEFCSILNFVYQEFSKSIPYIYRVLAQETEETLLHEWRDCTIHFARHRSAIYKSKEDQERQLKLSLGHPRWEVELEKLDQAAQNTCLEYKACIEQLCESCTQRLQNLSIEFTEKVEYSAYVLSAIFDGLVLLGKDMLEISNQVADRAEMARQAEVKISMLKLSNNQSAVKEMHTLHQGNSQVFSQTLNISKPSKTKRWAACSTSSFPFASLQSEVYQPQVLKARSTPLHTDLIASRDSTLDKFSLEINRRIRLLNEQIQIEQTAEHQWRLKWQNNVSRIKSSY
ncbi:hypothetical protein BDV3_006352 [Batrachochytrium dendrobatidis]